MLSYPLRIVTFGADNMILLYITTFQLFLIILSLIGRDRRGSGGGIVDFGGSIGMRV